MTHLHIINDCSKLLETPCVDLWNMCDLSNDKILYDIGWNKDVYQKPSMSAKTESDHIKTHVSLCFGICCMYCFKAIHCYESYCIIIPMYYLCWSNAIT